MSSRNQGEAYRFIDREFFRDPDFPTPEAKLMALWIFVHVDMAGICSVHMPTIRAATGLSKRKIETALNYFVRDAKKAMYDQFERHLWWKAGAFYALNKGNCSELQLKGVSRILRKWNQSYCFDFDFEEMVIEHYAMKYNIHIPYCKGEEWVSS